MDRPPLSIDMEGFQSISDLRDINSNHRQKEVLGRLSSARTVGFRLGDPHSAVHVRLSGFISERGKRMSKPLRVKPDITSPKMKGDNPKPIFLDRQTTRKDWGLNSSPTQTQRDDLDMSVQMAIEWMIKDCWAADPGDRPTMNDVTEYLGDLHQLMFPDLQDDQYESIESVNNKLSGRTNGSWGMGSGRNRLRLRGSEGSGSVFLKPRRRLTLFSESVDATTERVYMPLSDDRLSIISAKTERVRSLWRKSTSYRTRRSSRVLFSANSNEGQPEHPPFAKTEAQYDPGASIDYSQGSWNEVEAVCLTDM